MDGCSTSWKESTPISFEKKVPVLECSCQPTLDIINKFHHLDLAEAFLDHCMVEEIHHCTGSIGENKPQYEIVHCGCTLPHTCKICRRTKCVARLSHAINIKRVLLSLHIDFIGEENLKFLNEMNGHIMKVTFLEPCPKHNKWFHVNNNLKIDYGLFESVKEHKRTFEEKLEQDFLKKSASIKEEFMKKVKALL